MAFDYSVENKREEAEESTKSAAIERTYSRHFYRRAESEEKLFEIMPTFEKGCSYHVISYGDVDSLSFLKAIVKKQKIKNMLLSTWVISYKDFEDIEKWYKNGLIEKIDFYFGERLHKTRSKAFFAIRKFCKKNGFKFSTMNNHAKIMAGHGEDFSFAVESSANVNTNPRIENTTVTIDKKLADFYINFFEEIGG